MENVNAYAYKVYHSCTDECFCSYTSFLFLTDDKSKCEEYIRNYIREETEKEKYKDDDGNIVNWWWKFTKVEEIEVVNDVYGVKIL